MKSKDIQKGTTPEQAHELLYKYHEFIRPPEEIRNKLDIGYSFDGRYIEFFEIRPDWTDKTIIRHHPYAKIRYVKAHGVWRLFWRRASGKWETYKPFPESSDLGDLLEVIDEVSYGCFKG